jgi:predicted ATPase
MARGEEIEFADARLRSTPSEFIGRQREVAELCSGLEDARRGRGGFFLVTGEPGIGKTWLADEVARRAESSAMAVVRAGCWEGAGAPAYWPFIQVIRSALGGIKQDQGYLPKPLSGLQPALAHDLAQLVPAVQPAKMVSAGASAQPAQDPDQARFRLFDSVATVVREMAALRPLLLIVEDLHDADQPSLLMLRFVVRHLRDAPVLVLCTYRDVEVQHSPGLSRLVGYLTHEGIQVPLFALSRGETAQLIQERAGVPPNPRLVSDIY